MNKNDFLNILYKINGTQQHVNLCEGSKENNKSSITQAIDGEILK